MRVIDKYTKYRYVLPRKLHPEDAMPTHYPVTTRHQRSEWITMMLWFVIWLQFATAILLALEGLGGAAVSLVVVRAGAAVASGVAFVGLILLAAFLIAAGLYRLLKTFFKDVSMGLKLREMDKKD